MSGNALLLDVWRSYVAPLRRPRALVNRANSGVDSIVALHQKLFAALAASDIASFRDCYRTYGADVVGALRHFFDSDGINSA
jgi:DNA-binding FadR family transcriptional regulator